MPVEMSTASPASVSIRETASSLCPAPSITVLSASCDSGTLICARSPYRLDFWNWITSPEWVVATGSGSAP